MLMSSATVVKDDELAHDAGQKAKATSAQLQFALCQNRSVPPFTANLNGAPPLSIRAVRKPLQKPIQLLVALDVLLVKLCMPCIAEVKAPLWRGVPTVPTPTGSTNAVCSASGGGPALLGGDVGHPIRLIGPAKGCVQGMEQPVSGGTQLDRSHADKSSMVQTDWARAAQ